ncbi:methyl-coenzyme M reductase I operon protein C [Methanopyrus sp. KOL6]|uniref:methyl-coenzyme M reductase I operon protein C n=1 Tax=Methanopyrus sp. KOL6 TaxID=1937004 RepID=UPI000B4BEF3B|nr:methyl-coenzyme M reductase I operon protein C [Methanopyrus sp. KOL6]
MGRETYAVDCRAAMGMGKGGSLAQRGTIAETEITEVVAVAMSPGSRHITKPVCEITYALREAGIHTSVLVLNAGSGVPAEAPVRTGATMGIEPEEIERINRHEVAVIHLGNVKQHIVWKARLILKHCDIPAVIVCQTPVDFEDFAEVGCRTRIVEPPEPETVGEVVEIVTGVIRGETVPSDKINEIVRKVRRALRYARRRSR